MGNALLRFICGGCGGETPRTDDVSALVHDLHQFDITSQVPEGLGQHVVSSKKAQANWYKKLSEAWSEARPRPRTPEEAARLIVQTLKRHQHADVKGLLAFYGLPFPDTTTETTPTTAASSAKPVAIKYELHTLPVDLKSIADGDTVTVYVNVKDRREASTVPREVLKAAAARDKARARKDYKEADAIHKTIISAGYRVVKGSKDEEILAKKYRIRLSGIDAPESAMPYGKEAKDELVKLILGHPLKIYVYTTDQYGRSVGDIYCNGVFIQEKLLRGGWAWHYTAYDKRPDLAMWEKEARAARVGLWASANPEKPWDWRRERRNGA